MVLKAFLALTAAAIISAASIPIGQTQTEQTQTGQAQTEQERVEKPGRGVTPPRLTYSPEPEFSETARAAGYQGVCVLTLIVGADGMPRNIQVKNPIGMGLDEKAVEAVRSWRFSPALKDGKPVAVQIAVEVDFHLYTKPDTNFANLRAKAEAGDAGAQLDVANFYLKHRDVPENEQLGLTYLEKAANQGLARAQFLMGEHIAEKDASAGYAKAYMWYTLARRGGDKHSNKALKELTSKMTPEQLQQGQALVDNWSKAATK
jgi:TonB family protein